MYPIHIACMVMFTILPLQAQEFISLFGEMPDPHITYYNGYYYYTGTYNSVGVGLKRATTVEGLRTVPTQLVYDSSDGGPNYMYWASEIFRINNKWYIYYTASENNNQASTDFQRTYVIENSSENPLEGTWVNKGKIYDVNNDVWAIDGTIMDLNNTLYFVWSGSDIEDETPSKPQYIYIAPMSNPWTVYGSRVLLSTQTASWEGDQVNEAPEVIIHGNRVFIVYSSKGCWTPNYQLGAIYMNTSANPLDPESWTKTTHALFKKNSNSQVYGPGHHCFFKSPDGTEDWFAYHATPNSAGACDNTRTTRMQKLYWSANGFPVFGKPIKQGQIQNSPSGEVPNPTATPLENGIYKILVKSSDMAIDLGGCSLDTNTNVAQWIDLDNACQRWFVQSTGDGYYTISSCQSGLPMGVSGCSSANNANIKVWKPKGSYCQQWSIIEVSPAYYKVQSRHSGKVFHVSGGTAAGNNLVQNNYTGSDNQLMQFIRMDDQTVLNGTYYIRSKKSGKVLQLKNCNQGNSAHITQNTQNGTECQQWQILSTGDGYYKIISVLSGKALDIPSCKAEPSLNVQTWNDLNNNCQKWQFVSNGLGYFKIFTRSNGMSLDVAGCSISENAEILQYPYWGGGCQLWELELIDTLGLIDIDDESMSSDSNEVIVYPNPVKNTLYVRGNEDELFSVKLYTIPGEEVNKDITFHYSIGQVTLDLTKVEAGLYFLKTKTKVFKIYIQ